MHPVAGICAACVHAIKCCVYTGVHIHLIIRFKSHCAIVRRSAGTRITAVNDRHKVGRFGIELQCVHHLITFSGVGVRRLGVGQARAQRFFFKRRDLAADQLVPDAEVQGGNRRRQQRKDHDQCKRSG